MMSLKHLLFGLLLISPFASAEQVEIKHNSITLTANLEIADGKSIEDGVVLMTHGTLAHSKHEIMTAIQTSLADNDVNSLSINLGLGIDNRKGMYDCTAPHNHKHTDAAEEIGVWLNWLKEKNVKKVTLLGHSRGGNQTAWFAAENNDSVIQHVVLVAPATWDKDKHSKSYQKRYGQDLAEIMAKAKKLVDEGKGDTFMEKTNFVYCEDTSVTAASFVNYYTPNEKFNTPILIPEIKKPVLVVIGTRDDVVTNLKEQVEPLVEDGKVSILEIDGAGHFFRDLYAEEIGETVAELMGSE